MKLSFSIVINTYNRAHTLGDTLQSLQYLRYPRFEVIVVNGPSTDSTEEILSQYEGKIVKLNCSYANLSISRNVGIAAAKGDIVCFIDDDAIPEPNWLDLIATGYTKPEIAAVGGYIRDHTGYTYQSRALVCNRFGVGTDYDLPDPRNVDSASAKPTKYFSLTGTNCTFRRSALLEIGGFDEEYAYFLDETDVVIRLVDIGYEICYVPAAEIHHKYASSHLRSATRIPKSIYLPARSKAYFCMKNAAPVHGSAAVLTHLEEYRSSLRKDYDWYLHHSKIDAEHHASLHEDIDRGIHDGLKDAYHYTSRKLLPVNLFQPNREFAHYPILIESAKRLRICFLSQEYPPSICGGIGNWTHTLATALAKLGHEISVVTKGGEHNRVDFQEGVWVHRVVPVWQPNRIHPPLPDIPQIIKDYSYTVFDEVMRINIIRGLDIVSSPIWDLEGIACISDGGLPNILSLHTSFKLALPSKPEWLRNADYKKNHVDKIIEGEKWLLENSPYILANSEAIVADIEREYEISLGKARYTTVPHGIRPISTFSESNIKKISDGKKLNLLYVGRFEKRKGTDLLLEVLPDILEKYPDIVVNLVGNNDIEVGDGPSLWMAFSQKYAQKAWMNRISAPGLVSEEALQAHYRNADIFVAPSRYESFGLIFLEAMRVGVACIGTRIGGIAEVIEDGVTGILCEPNDANSLKEAMEHLVTQHALRQKLSRNSYVSFVKHFSDASMAQSCANVYQQLITRVV